MLSTEQIAYYAKYFKFIDEKIRFEGLGIDEISIVSLKKALGGKQQTCKNALNYYRDVYCVNGRPLVVNDNIQSAFEVAKNSIDELLPVIMQFAADRVKSEQHNLLNDIDIAEDKIGNLSMELKKEREQYDVQTTSLRHDLNLAESIVSDLTQKCSSYEGQILQRDKLIEKTNSTLSDERLLHSEKLENCQKNIAQLNTIINKLKDDNLELTTLNAELKTELVARQATIESTEHREKLLKDKLNKEVEKLKSTKSELSCALCDNENLEIKNKNLTTELEECLQQNGILNEQSSIQRKKYTSATQSLSTLKTTLSDRENELHRLNEEVKDSKHELRLQLLEMQNITASKDRAEQVNHQLLSQVESLKTNNELLQSIISKGDE